MKKKVIGIIGVITVTVILLATAVIYGIFSTGIPAGEVKLHNQGETVTLSGAEANVIRSIFTLHFYRYGIGGCPYGEGVSISIGDREFFLATDGCPTAKDSKNEDCMEFDQVQWGQIQTIFSEHFGETLID